MFKFNIKSNMATILISLLFSASLVGANTYESVELSRDFVEHAPYERVITNIRDVFNGVDVILSIYNDTTPPSEEGLPSVPGCPKNDIGYPWVYYRPTSVDTVNKCYLTGERGPCQPGQSIFVESGSPFGYCNCDCFRSLRRNITSREMFCSPPSWNTKYVFYSDVKKCHALFDQGPCKDNEWLVEMDENEKRYSPPSASLTKCEERRCPVGQLLEPGFGCVHPESRAYAGVFTAGPNSCPPDEKYSTLLQKCLPKAPIFTF